MFLEYYSEHEETMTLLSESSQGSLQINNDCIVSKANTRSENLGIVWCMYKHFEYFTETACAVVSCVSTGI